MSVYEESRFYGKPYNSKEGVVPIPCLIAPVEVGLTTATKVGSFHYGSMVFAFDRTEVRNGDALRSAFCNIFKRPKSNIYQCKKCKLKFANFVQYRAHNDFSLHNRNCGNYIALSSRNNPACFFIDALAAKALLQDNTSPQLDILDPKIMPTLVYKHLSAGSNQNQRNEKKRLKKQDTFISFLNRSLAIKHHNNVNPLSIFYSFLKPTSKWSKENEEQIKKLFKKQIVKKKN